MDDGTCTFGFSFFFVEEIRVGSGMAHAGGAKEFAVAIGASSLLLFLAGFSVLLFSSQQQQHVSEGAAGFLGGKQRGRNRDWLGELDPLAVPIWNIASRSSSSSRACMCRGLAVRAVVVSMRAPSPNKWSLGVRGFRHSVQVPRVGRSEHE